MPSTSRSCRTASACAIPFSRRAPVAIPGPRGPCLVIVPELVMSLAYVCMCMLRLQSLLPLSVPGIWFHHHHRPRTPSSTQDSRGGGRRRCFGRAAARPPHSPGYGCLGGSCDTLPLASLQRRPDKLQLTVCTICFAPRMSHRTPRRMHARARRSLGTRVMVYGFVFFSRMRLKASYASS